MTSSPDPSITPPRESEAGPVGPRRAAQVNEGPRGGLLDRPPRAGRGDRDARRGRRARGAGGRPARVRSAVLAAVALVAAGIGVPWAVSVTASAATTSLVVNSTAWGGADSTPGNGVCETAPGNGVCTLRAAIQEANALAGQPGDVEIVVDPSIPLGTKMTGTANVQANNMLNANITAEDTGAVFHVTAPVTIDLGHRLQPDGSANDTGEWAVFFVDSPDVSILNADMVLSSGSSFVIGPKADRVTIDGDTGGGFGQIATPNFNSERFVVLREGAANVTIQHYQITGYYDSATSGGIFVFDVFAPYTQLTNIVVDGVQLLYSTASNNTCSGSNGSGCRTRILNFWTGTSSNTTRSQTVIRGLVFRNMLVENMTSQYSFQFGNPGDTGGTNSITLSGLVMEDNVFVENQGVSTGGTAFINLPYHNHLQGTNVIARNVFSRASTGQTDAIIYYGNNAIAADSTAPSGLTIADNHFDGYTGAATIRTERSGLVTVTGNTFGPRTGSQAAPGTTEEYSDSASVMYNTFHGSPLHASNQTIRTWAPTAAASVPTGQLPTSALVAADPRDGALPTCTVTVPVSKITATDNNSQAPGEPVTLQAYWTAQRTAEVYLGEVTGVTGTTATLALPLPVGPVTLPDGTTTTVVDATTGKPAGFIRLQTHVEGLGQLESSQYSRFVSVFGLCRPVLTIDQAAGMTDPTLGRDLHFTLVSSVPLDPGTVTVGDIAVTAQPVAQTINAALLNPQVISVTPVPGSGNTVFDVVVRVDDSAAVTVAVAAEAVATPSGLTNPDPATSADGTITFLNPLRVDPPQFTLVTGEPHGKTFTVSVAAGAPTPASDLVFQAVVSQPVGTPPLTLSTTTPVLPAGATAAPPVTVTAAAGSVTANTETTIALTVASADPNYDGLLVPSVKPFLFSTDPTLHITKEAYVDVGDPSSAAQIKATGTLAPAGSRLLDRQAVCFVYTVTNTSADDWATKLTDVTVTDSDTRLGSGGMIGTLPALDVGQSAQLFACTTLLPLDTTVADAAATGTEGS